MKVNASCLRDAVLTGSDIDDAEDRVLAKVATLRRLGHIPFKPFRPSVRKPPCNATINGVRVFAPA